MFCGSTSLLLHERSFNVFVFVRQAICGYGAQDTLPFRSVKEGELFFVEDREINLIELALATNIPKGCAETMVRGVCVVFLISPSHIVQVSCLDRRAKTCIEGVSVLWQ